jgi:hypothetical protein
MATASLGECLFQISDDVFRGFKADRYSNETIRNTQ